MEELKDEQTRKLIPAEQFSCECCPQHGLLPTFAFQENSHILDISEVKETEKKRLFQN